MEQTYSIVTEERTYRILTENDEYERVFQQLKADNLFWAFDCEYEEPDKLYWIERCKRPDMLLLEGLINGEPAGLLKVVPFMERTRCGEIGVVSYRDFFSMAAWLARGAFLWCFEHLDCVCLVGRVPLPNRHALRMARKVGFVELGRIEQMCWYSKKQRFVDGVFMKATKETVQKMEVLL